MGQLPYGQNGLKSTAIGSRSESGCRYLGDGLVSEDCLARFRLQESGSRDNAENLSVRVQAHGSRACGVRALACVCGVSVRACMRACVHACMRACVRYTHTYTRVYARKLVCVFVHACVCLLAHVCVHRILHPHAHLSHLCWRERSALNLQARHSMCSTEHNAQVTGKTRTPSKI